MMTVMRWPHASCEYCIDGQTGNFASLAGSRLSCGWRSYGVELRNGSKAEVESWSLLGGFRAALPDWDTTEPVFPRKSKAIPR